MGTNMSKPENEPSEYETQLGERAKASRSIADQAALVLQSLSRIQSAQLVGESMLRISDARRQLRFLQIEADNFAAEQEEEYRNF